MKKLVTTKNTLKFLVATNKRGEQVYKALMTHPMESGLRREYRTGAHVPADFIEEYRVSVDGETVFEITMGPDVAKNPFVSFVLTRPVIDNQRIRVSWVENNGTETFYDCVVKFGNNASFSFKGEDKSIKVYREVPEITSEVAPYCKQKTTGVEY